MANDLIQAEIAKLQASALLFLYVLDATAIGGEFFRFYPGFDAQAGTLRWQGMDYTPWPVDTKGFDINATGSPARPSIIFSNQLSTFSALANTFDDLIGAQVVRKRTFYKFLDDQPGADDTQKFPDDIFYVERKINESKYSVEFELVSSFDLDDLYLPKRTIYSTLCGWKYRGSECSFGGNYPVADQFDAAFNLTGIHDKGIWTETKLFNVNDFTYKVYGPLRRYYLCYRDNAGVAISGEQLGPPNPTYWKSDTCSKTLNGCTLRFGGSSPLPFGGFPGTEKFPF